MYTGQGTINYMSPEVYEIFQKTGKIKSYSGLASDIYSLGVVLFTTYTGRPPFFRDEELQYII
jgi:serine/threonine protein kinase